MLTNAHPTELTGSLPPAKLEFAQLNKSNPRAVSMENCKRHGPAGRHCRRVVKCMQLVRDLNPGSSANNASALPSELTGSLIQRITNLA
ncbi:hypothetical protein DPMN_164232 [Dreissena polymorpha]|uniref:Uncharacterized protein n=1 Tax=Dreissena polymorpha TaxID=45954 RepID=A0A9D4ESJ1_DREPO|nr:hypothetical protein DPMN_164232 [Dreissena polymorpha]